MNRYKLRIVPLTGIHIGTGNTIDPSEYTIIESSQKNRIYIRFSIDSVFDSFNQKEKKEFLKILDGNNYTEIRNYVSEKANINNMLYGSHITESFYKLFSGNKRNPNNQLEIAEAYRPPNKKRPIIPGSSLKGAIRTAILDHVVHSSAGGPNSYRNLTAGIFGKKSDREFQRVALSYSHDAKNDPFRAVRISDAGVEGKKIMIVGEMVNFSESKHSLTMETKGMQIFAEIIRGKMLDGDASAETEISIDDLLQNTKSIHAKNWSGIKNQITAEDILHSCNDFYQNAWEKEYNKFYKTDDDLKLVGDELNEYISDISTEKGEFLLRLGRFSQAECVTINDLRKPWNTKGYGKSRTAFKYDDKIVPLGWTKIRIQGGS